MRASGAARALGRCVPIFAALGDESRLAIVERLCARGPTSVTGLSDGAGITRQAVSKHLRVLADAGLVKNSREGRESVWEFKPRRLDEARRALAVISRRWDLAIDRLRRLVEE
jgi:DNA-binding transcriptional ArsR family regulator